MIVHQVQRGEARFALALDLHPLRIGQRVEPDEPQPEAHRGEVRLMTILLPEHPAQHVCLVEMTVWDQLAAVGEVEADGVAFGQEPVAVLQYRDSAVGIDVPQIFGRAGLALHDVVVAPFELNAEVRRGQPDLVAIPRPRIFVEGEGDHALVTSTILPTWSPASIRTWAAAASSSGKLWSMT